MRVEDCFQLPSAIRRILIIQLGDIGDVVWTLPTLLSVHTAYPGAELSVLVREGAGGLLAAEPYLCKVFETRAYGGGISEKAKQQLLLIRALRHEHFDLVIDLRAGDRGAFMARLTGAPIRASLLYVDASFWRNRMFTHLVRPANENIRLSYGAAEQSLRIVRGLGMATGANIPVLNVADQAKKTARKLLNALNPPWSADAVVKETMITLNPFSKWSYKQWDVERWLPVIDWLAAEFNFKTVIIGSDSERLKAAELVGKSAGRAFNAAGDTTLAELAAVLSFSRLHVGVDSAAPHIAAAVGTPTVTIYGPSDWRDWAPVGELHRVVSSDMDCSPCHQKGCDGQGHSRCLENISVDKVKEAIRSAVLPHQSA